MLLPNLMYLHCILYIYLYLFGIESNSEMHYCNPQIPAFKKRTINYPKVTVGSPKKQYAHYTKFELLHESEFI
jgi:hypothetical protein